MSPEPNLASRRLLVVDDHPVVRRGLVALLGSEPWVGGVDEADSLASALSTATHHPPAWR